MGLAVYRGSVDTPRTRFKTASGVRSTSRWREPSLRLATNDEDDRNAEGAKNAEEITESRNLLAVLRCELRFFAVKTFLINR